MGKVYLLASSVVGCWRIHFLTGCRTEVSVPQEQLATDLLDLWYMGLSIEHLTTWQLVSSEPASEWVRV